MIACWCWLKCSDWQTDSNKSKQDLHRQKPLLLQNVNEFLYLVPLKNFTWTTGLYLSYMLFLNSTSHPSLCTVGVSYNYITNLHIISCLISLLVICRILHFWLLLKMATPSVSPFYCRAEEVYSRETTRTETASWLPFKITTSMPFNCMTCVCISCRSSANVTKTCICQMCLDMEYIRRLDLPQKVQQFDHDHPSYISSTTHMNLWVKICRYICITMHWNTK